LNSLAGTDSHVHDWFDWWKGLHQWLDSDEAAQSNDFVADFARRNHKDALGVIHQGFQETWVMAFEALIQGSVFLTSCPQGDGERQGSEDWKPGLREFHRLAESGRLLEGENLPISILQLIIAYLHLDFFVAFDQRHPDLEHWHRNFEFFWFSSEATLRDIFIAQVKYCSTVYSAKHFEDDKLPEGLENCDCSSLERLNLAELFRKVCEIQDEICDASFKQESIPSFRGLALIGQGNLLFEKRFDYGRPLETFRNARSRKKKNCFN